MPKYKFYYDQETLSYKRIEVNNSVRFRNAFVFITVSAHIEILSIEFSRRSQPAKWPPYVCGQDTRFSREHECVAPKSNGGFGGQEWGTLQMARGHIINQTHPERMLERV